MLIGPWLNSFNIPLWLHQPNQKPFCCGCGWSVVNTTPLCIDMRFEVLAPLNAVWVVDGKNALKSVTAVTTQMF
jgi:hypothetical protein